MKQQPYVIIDYPRHGQTSGRYWGRYPKQAASKVLTRLSQNNPEISNDNEKFVKFTIRNSNTGKEYTYMGTRVRLKRPEIRFINGRRVQFNYNNILTIAE